MREAAHLREVIEKIWWMARRYADGRQTYATGLFNDSIREAQALGCELKPDLGTFWARDRDGRSCDGLSEADAAMGEPLREAPRDVAITALRDIRNGTHDGTAQEHAKYILDGLEGHRGCGDRS